MSLVYLAGRYGRREELLSKAGELEAAGHVVTARWLEGLDDEGNGDFTHGHDGQAARWAEKDLADIEGSEVVISFTEGGGGRGGRHVELGYALADPRRRCILVGPAEHVFHWHPRVEHFGTWDEAKAAL